MGRSTKRKQFKRQLSREKQLKAILAEKSIKNTKEEDISLDTETVIQSAEHFAYTLNDFKQSLEVLTPLLLKSTPPLRALLCAFFVATKTGDFETALNYLNIIKLDKEPGVGLAKVKGDILLKLGKMTEAIYSYDKEIEKSDPEAKFIGLFSRAWAKLQNSDVSQAVEDALKGVKIWFDDIVDPDFLFFYEKDIIRTNYSLFSFESPIECIEKVCRHLLQETKDVQILNKDLKGQLSYILFSFRRNQIDLLLQAADLIDHPKLSIDLSHYFFSTNELSLAVHHHLKYCLWQYTIYSKSENTSIVDANFDYVYDGDLINTKTKCTKIHKSAIKHLKSSKNSEVIRNIFIPFYQSFWKKLLLNKNMYIELVEVITIFIDHVQDDNTVFWDYAFYLREVKANNEAEKAYKDYLERWPTNASAMHNLSIILGEKGAYQEALQLSSKAATIAPNDDIIIKRHKYLKENLFKLQNDFQENQEWINAYNLHQRGLLKDAKEAYTNFMEKWSNYAGAAHNLSIILDEEGDTEGALKLSNKVLSINPTNNFYIRHNNKIKDKIVQQNRRKQENLDLFSSASEKWHLVDYYKKSLLVSLMTITSFNSWKHLSELTGLEEKYLPGHWRKLVELGMIIDKNDQYHINEYILPLVKQHQASSNASKFVSIETTKVSKPVLNTKSSSPDSLDLTLFTQKEIKLFYCYAREDKDLRDELAMHLSNLKRQIQFIDWHDREILPGTEWEKEIDIHLNSAHVILLLISARFMASDYCYGVEMKRALERHNNKEAFVVPILLRPVDWFNAPFSKIQILPTNAKPVTSWLNHDEAFADIAMGIREVVGNLISSFKVTSK